MPGENCVFHAIDFQKGYQQFARTARVHFELTENRRFVTMDVKGNYGKHVYHSISQSVRDHIKLLYRPEKQEIAAIFNRSGLSKADFLTEVESIIPQRHDAPFPRLPEFSADIETYATRDKSKYANPIDYVEKRWGDYVASGAMNLQDLNRLDPKAAPAVRSYCQRMALAEPENADYYVASKHLPQGRRQRTPDVEETIEGSPAHTLAKMRADSRARMARARANTREPSR